MSDKPLYRTQKDYELPLLRLLYELPNGQGEAAEVRRLFQRKFGDQIPPEHYGTRRGGELVWENNVNWCRNYLRERGFLDKPRTGIWHITKAGRQWLEENPDTDRLPIFIYDGSGKSKQKSPSTKSPSLIQTSQPRQDKVALRDTFFQQIAAHLRPKLLGEISHGEINLFPGKNWMQVYYPEFPNSHYELGLRRSADEVGFHFEASQIFSKDENLARLALMQPHIAQLSQLLGHQVVAEPWGSLWARLSIHLNQASWNPSQAKVYADLLARFIAETFPLLRQVFAATRSQRGRSSASPTGTQDQEAHVILDRQINHIREYLRGRVARPSEEVLCEWVYFCYTFELFKEAVELFNLINPEAVDTWPYERAKRIARVCRIRANVS